MHFSNKTSCVVAMYQADKQWSSSTLHQQPEAARSPEEPWRACYLIQGDRKYGQEI